MATTNVLGASVINLYKAQDKVKNDLGNKMGKMEQREIEGKEHFRWKGCVEAFVENDASSRNYKASIYDVNYKKRIFRFHIYRVQYRITG